jgi:membrane associated rhomboid family serine protease
MLIPLKDDNPTRRRPVITLALILLNVLVMLYQFTLSERGEAIFIHQFGMVPTWLFGDGSISFPAHWLARETTLVTYMFLHGGLMHLGFNMWFLWIFGNNIEDALGPLRFVAFYLIGGVAASLCQLVMDLDSKVPVVGASGAIAAILGAYLVLYPRKNVSVLIWILIFIRVIKVPAAVVLSIWFLLQVLWTYLSSGTDGGGVAWMAHIGGFVFGMFVIRLFGPRLEPPQEPLD